MGGPTSGLLFYSTPQSLYTSYPLKLRYRLRLLVRLPAYGFFFRCSPNSYAALKGKPPIFTLRPSLLLELWLSGNLHRPKRLTTLATTGQPGGSRYKYTPIKVWKRDEFQLILSF